MCKPAPNYPWQNFTGDPADELHELQKAIPCEAAPAFIWIEWHERQVSCWERIAASDSAFIEHETLLGDQHRLKIKELHEDPHGLGGRRGYWTP